MTNSLIKSPVSACNSKQTLLTFHRLSVLVLCALAGLLTACSHNSTLATAAANPTTTGVAYPLKAGANGRYFVDQNNVPFLILGDSPQSIAVNLSTTLMASYMADRQAHGFNTLLVDALVNTYTGGNASGTTYDGIAPFTSGSSAAGYDLSTPNPVYFSRFDALVSMAAARGLALFVDPIETGGWLTTLENNGATKAFEYGAFLGNRYKNSANVMWQSGNDFQAWNTNSTDNYLVDQVMAGIASAAPKQVQTIELNFDQSYSSEDVLLQPFLNLDAVYTYYETYDEVLMAYNRLPTLPTFLTEANYEYENNTGFLSGLAGPFVLREQEYWTMTSGACGQLYGNHYTWSFATGWQNYLDSPGTAELAYLLELFNSISWWKLVPDEDHQVVVSGYGTYNGTNGNLALATYATTSWIPDGSVAVTYDPAGNPLTVNLTAFAGPVTAAWYDPSSGIFKTIAGSPFANAGTQQFTPQGTNNDGDEDWVLVLEVNPAFPKTLARASSSHSLSHF